jgi:glutaredoxin
MHPRRSKAHVIIYSRPGCHLCDEAKQAIESAQCNDEYTLEEIDIESDIELLRRYRYDIPVITINGEEAFRHRVTAAEFRKRLHHASG